MSLNLADMSHLIGYKVRINRRGPDSVEGILAAIHDDYLRIELKNEIVFVKNAHIKSITQMEKVDVPLASSTNFMALLHNSTSRYLHR